MRFAITVFHLNISSRIFEIVTGKWIFFVQKFFFSSQISKVAIIKTKSATIAIFFLLLSSSTLFLLLLSFSFVSVILELIAPTKTCLLTPFRSNHCNFVRLVFKKSARCIQHEVL